MTWLVTGGAGLFGRAFCEHLRAAGHRVTVVRRRAAAGAGTHVLVADLSTDFDAGQLLERSGATHVVHAAALTDVDLCERRQRGAYRLHVDATRALAAAAHARAARFTLISTDQLWARLPRPATESLPPTPVNTYGRTKAAGERVAMAACPDALVVRTNFFGAGTESRRSSSDRIVDALSTGQTYRGFADVWFTPIGLPLLCRLLLDIVAVAATGIVHVGGGERLSKLDFARRIAAHYGFPPDRVAPASVATAPLAAPRPRDMSLDSTRAARLVGRPMPSVAESIAAVFASNTDRARARE
jgi:dTDP-4-dehydrorhamnose reductase